MRPLAATSLFALALVSVLPTPGLPVTSPALAQDPAPNGAPTGAATEDGKLLEKRLAEVVATVNGEAKAQESTFAPSFLAKVPTTQIDSIGADYRKRGGKVTGSRFLPAGEGAPRLAREFELDLEKGTVKGSIALEPKEPHRIAGLFFRAVEPRVATFDALKKELAKLPGKVSFAAARLDGDKTANLSELAPDESLAIGSSFKLYILGALLEDVTAGKRKLADTTTLTEERRSLPSGFLQTWPVGAPVTLHTLASLMISISDNTATDTLLHELGRERVEKALVSLGNSKPDRTTPFLATSEMFRIKWGEKKDLADQWCKADVAGRRAILGDLGKMPLPKVDAIASSEPTRIDAIEWFASANDLVRAMNGIRKLTAEGPANAGRAILAINPGADVKNGFRYVGFKGGSEPGVLELAWLLEREDGAWFSVALGWNDPDEEVDTVKLVGLASKAIELVRGSK